MRNGRNERQIIKGIICRYYDYLDRADSLHRKQAEIYMIYGNPKAVSYDPDNAHTQGKTNDERLAAMSDKISSLQEQEKNIRNKARNISKRYRLYLLSQKQREAMQTVYHSSSYEEAGKKLGYSAIQIYRIMKDIYDFIEQYL